jgi:AraC-like DNA-binding protein
MPSPSRSPANCLATVACVSWVVQRYRLFEAADRLASEPDLTAAQLAQQLGYTDQAHFSREFKSMVGRSPAEYAREQE